MEEPQNPSKKRKLSSSGEYPTTVSSLQRAISPSVPKSKPSTTDLATESKQSKAAKNIPSPVQLSSIDGIPADCNIDTVSLRDVVGHPLIKECWAFNYLIDVDFILGHCDPDVRDQIELSVIHGSWKKEDDNRIRLEDCVAKHKNVKAITAYMPEAFGTHHSKMIITVRHDDVCQVSIFTANLIEQDWNMCQAVWMSPLLPLLQTEDSPKVTDTLGRGSRFKFDLLSYLRAYGNKLKDLISTLEKFDFSSIRAALIASTPCRQGLGENSNSSTSMGWPGLRKVLSQIPCKGLEPHIVVQVSSIATLGVQDTYLRRTFFPTLARSSSQRDPNPKFSVIFPTAEDVRRTITGYACGASIHMKIESPQQAKQLQYLRPFLCRWAPDLRGQDGARRAGRRRAGPHIKTYIRFSDTTMTDIDWAMVTSANLSKQAWGAEASNNNDVRICSYELGVVVWPALWNENSNDKANMVPTFKKDQPDAIPTGKANSAAGDNNINVGFRMPYDLPLVPYTATEEPWCATKSYVEEDWMGRVWIRG